tara:strand:- start:456 stop:1283 length:828 start_codon:yes stop_codon:yes gene_type:complete
MFYKKELLSPYRCDDLIRVGREKDGGYIISKRITNASQFLLSGGIYTDWSFEKEFINLSKIKKFILVDKDTAINSQFKHLINFLINKKIKFIYKIKRVFHFLYNVPRIFIFRRICKDNFIEAYLTSSRFEISRKEKMITLSTLFKKLNCNVEENSIFLKLDIEGSEWEMITDILEISKYLSGIALEVHDLDIYGNKLKELIIKLNNAGLYLIHVHPNNAGGFCDGTNLPKLLELTFLNRNLFSKDELFSKKEKPFLYIKELDRPCDPRRPEMFIE